MDLKDFSKKNLIEMAPKALLQWMNLGTNSTYNISLHREATWKYENVSLGVLRIKIQKNLAATDGHFVSLKNKNSQKTQYCQPKG